MPDGIDHGSRRIAGERPPAGAHLVHHNTERKQIRPGIDGLAARLFGRHVGDCAGDAAGRRQRPITVGNEYRGILRRTVSARILRPDGLCQPEIHHFDLSERCYEEVRRLDVPMDDIARMSGFERLRDLAGEGNHLRNRASPAAMRSRRVSPSRYSMTRYPVAPS